jgi:hypothetical protein
MWKANALRREGEEHWELKDTKGRTIAEVIQYGEMHSWRTLGGNRAFGTAPDLYRAMLAVESAVGRLHQLVA